MSGVASRTDDGMARDFYEILGVKRDAKTEEIKRAYRTLAKKYHPDRNPNDPSAEAKFKEVQEAYATLSHAEKRAEYDRFGAAGVGQWKTKPGGERVYQWGGGSAVNVEDLEDLFSAFGAGGEHATVFDQFFGRGGGQLRAARARPQRGTDEEHEVTLTFDQAIHGTTLSLQLRTGDNGRTETIEVKIPAGVDDGQKIRVRGRIPGQHGGAPGDLILRVKVLPHPYFKRSGDDIYVEVPVSVTEAALGGKIEVPSIDGRSTVALPPGTPSGAKLRLSGRGIKRKTAESAGDQYVTIKIVPPKKLDEKQRSLFEQLHSLDEIDVRRDAPWNRGK